MIDPCCGSGHILVYAFDVLLQIYISAGWSERDAARSILENNLYGLDIDDRAGQLAYFAVMMKARKYSRRILNGDVKPNVLSIQESNWMTDEFIGYVAGKDSTMKADLVMLRKIFKDAKEYGSILNVPPMQYDALYERIDILSRSYAEDIFQTQYNTMAVEQLLPLVEQSQIMSQKYDVVVTNPPYMAITNTSPKLYDYVNKYYPYSKGDLFAVFIEKCHQMLVSFGLLAMITQHAWMFLSSFEKLRSKLLTYTTINMAHLGPRAFEEISGDVVQTTTFVIANHHIRKYLGSYMRLVEPTTQVGKEELFLSKRALYHISQDKFSLVPGSPYAYWVSQNFIANFEKSHAIGETRKGMVTADNPRFIRTWSEVDYQKIGIGLSSRDMAKASKRKWFPYVKGGEYRKWYGNLDWVVNWENDGFELLNMKGQGYKVGSTNHNLPFIFKPAVCWTKISSSFSARIVGIGYLIDDASPFISVVKEQDRLFCLGLYNSPISQEYLDLLNPTMNFSPGTISNIPYLDYSGYSENIITIVNRCIDTSKQDWDSFETSWDFKKHPLI